jgi:DNA repair protein RadC
MSTKINYSQEDRPTYKVVDKGVKALSDKEIISAIIGDANKAATDKIKSVSDLAGCSIIEISNLGFTMIQAAQIKAAIELGIRVEASRAKEYKKITSSRDSASQFPHLRDLDVEHFEILILDQANNAKKIVRISEGGYSATVVDVRMVFKFAIENKARAIILAHNHPSANKKPSQADITLTKKMTEAGKIMDIPVLDHIIIAGNEYFSFADEGLL